MKDVTDNFIQEKNRQVNEPITLFILHNYDGSDKDLRFADYDKDVVFDSLTYTRFPIKFSSVGENSRGEIDNVRVEVCNISRFIQAQLELYDLRQRQLTIRLVWLDLLADPDACIDHVFFIDSYSSDQSNVVFDCTSRLDVLGRSLPNGMYLRTHCRYKKFKDPATCGYAGAETECNRTMQRCKELGNFQRFGGCPSLPLRRLYVA